MVNGTTDGKAEGVTGAVTFSGKTVSLAADIDLNAGGILQWTPIGTSAAPFKGTFDAGGHIISALSIANTASYQGLFGYIDNAAVKNLTITGSIIGAGYLGGIVGYACSTASAPSAFTDCLNQGNITGGTTYIGGIVGYIYMAEAQAPTPVRQ